MAYRPAGRRVLWSLAAFVCIFVSIVLGAEPRTVSSASELVVALRNPSVNYISISGVLNLDTLPAAAASAGVTIGPNRVIEIVGNVTVLDLQNKLRPQALKYASGIDFGSTGVGFMRLADNTSLVFRDLILWHGLGQLGYDWQVVSLAQPGARVSLRFTRTIKLRDGCIPLQIFVQHVSSYPRLPGVPGPQVAALEPFCVAAPPGYLLWRSQTTVNGTVNGTAVNATAGNATAGAVTCLPEVLAIDDLATTITRSSGETYSLYEQDAVHWCTAYVSMSCLSASGPEQCVKDLLASLTNRSSANATSGLGGDSSDSGLTNILLPALLTGVMTLGFVGATVWCLHRRGAAPRGSSLGAVPGLAAAAAAGGDGGGGGDPEQGGVGGGGLGGRVGHALSRLLPRVADAKRSKPFVPGYVPVVSKEALDRIAKVRAELSTKMVVASSADDLSDVRNVHLVGKGTFGRVYKGEWRGVTVALKVISVPVSECGQAQWQAVTGEAAISTLLNHPCVLQTYAIALLELSPARKPPSTVSEEGGTPSVNNAPAGSVGGGGGGGGRGGHSGEQQLLASESQLGDELAPIYQLKMVSEFCEGGSVVAALRRMHFYDSTGGGTVRLPAIVDIAMQVASGMAYLHSANIIHADLKAANVLLKQQPGSGRLQAKVADFGLSFRVEPEATHVTKGQLGSLTHMAPEVLMQGRVSKASDVYSFGILLYELYTGQGAYWDVPQPMLAYHVTTAGGRPLLPPHCPPAFRGLAKACWSSDVAARPTFQQIYDNLRELAAGVNNSFKAPTLGSVIAAGGAAGRGGADAASAAAAAAAGAASAAAAATAAAGATCDTEAAAAVPPPPPPPPTAATCGQHSGKGGAALVTPNGSREAAAAAGAAGATVTAAGGETWIPLNAVATANPTPSFSAHEGPGAGGSLGPLQSESLGPASTADVLGIQSCDTAADAITAITVAALANGAGSAPAAGPDAFAAATGAAATAVAPPSPGPQIDPQRPAAAVAAAAAGNHHPDQVVVRQVELLRGLAPPEPDHAAIVSFLTSAGNSTFAGTPPAGVSGDLPQ